MSKYQGNNRGTPNSRELMWACSVKDFNEEGTKYLFHIRIIRKYCLKLFPVLFSIVKIDFYINIIIIDKLFNVVKCHFK